MANGSLEQTRRPESLTSWAVVVLREQILLGTFQAGETLVIADLSERLGLSATPLREALQRLAAEGLVVFESNRKIRVPTLNEEDCGDISDMRLKLEPLAFHRSLLLADDDWKEEVQASFARFEEATDGDLTLLEGAHLDFHRTLLSRCTSPTLTRVVDLLLNQSARYRIPGLVATDGHSGLVDRHRALLESCLALDVDTAVERYTQHIANAGTDQIARLRANNSFG